MKRSLSRRAGEGANSLGGRRWFHLGPVGQLLARLVLDARLAAGPGVLPMPTLTAECSVGSSPSLASYPRRRAAKISSYIASARR